MISARNKKQLLSNTNKEGSRMNIDNNETEKRAMAEFHQGNRKEGLRTQEESAPAFRTEYAQKDHCPCRKACRYHGNCKECVAIHRAHQEHVPNCMRPMINKKIKLLSELTEHTYPATISGFPDPEIPPKNTVSKSSEVLPASAPRV